MLVTETDGLGVGIVIHAGDEDYLSAVAAGGLDLGKGCALGDADDGMDAHVAGGKGHALCVVAGRAGDDATALLLLGQSGDLIIRTTELKCARFLQTLGLQEQRAALPHRTGRNERGFIDDTGQNAPRVPNHFHLQHDCFLLDNKLYF